MSKDMRIGYNKPLYILPFDHRSSFEKGLYGWSGVLSAEQTEQIARAKGVIYDAFKFALRAGVAKDRAGILVDEQFGARILRDANANGFITAMPAEKSGQTEFQFEFGAQFAGHIESGLRPSSSAIASSSVFWGLGGSILVACGVSLWGESTRGAGFVSATVSS
jgi:myo-inositol catabolism protein IolC